MELYKGPLQLFRRFRVGFVDEGKPGKHFIKGGISFFTDMWMRIEEREREEKLQDSPMLG
jgi:hypothetical protein